MEQKDYALEIVNVLAKGKSHIREISSLIGVNHMMVVRKMGFLEKNNVVDFVKEGRNKVYFLKQSPETRSFVLMSKNYFLVRLLFKHKFLRDIVNKIQEDKRIKFACIFGSYSKGLETRGSDVDIYIETENLGLKKEYSRIDSKFSVKIGKWVGSSLLVKEIIENNILIKGGDVYYERVFG